MKKIVALTIFAMVMSFVPMANASGVVLTVTPDVLTAATATDVVLSWTASGISYDSGDTIVLAIKDDTDTLIAGTPTAHTTAETNIDDDANDNDGSATYAAGLVTYTISSGALVTTTTRTLGFKTPALDAGVYSISMVDSGNSDFGAVLMYVGEDNVVVITADVGPQLNFVIRTNTDQQNLGDDNDATPGTAPTTEVPNNCRLGTLSLTAVNSCSYRLKVSTNASSGYTVKIAADGDLSKTTTGDVADIDDIDPVVEDLTVIVGSEAYGIAFNPGSATLGVTAADGDFTDDDTPIGPATTAYTLYTSTGPNSPAATDTANTALVTHIASMDTGTASGFYTQKVTYTVTGSF